MKKPILMPVITIFLAALVLFVAAFSLNDIAAKTHKPNI